YAPAQIVRDAREHGVEVRPIDVAFSAWDCTLEAGALRLGFRLISGFEEKWAEEVVKARGKPSPGVMAGPVPAITSGTPPRMMAGTVAGHDDGDLFQDGVWQPIALLRSGLPRAALMLLAEADALRSQKLDRRAALWQVRGLPDLAGLPLFADQPAMQPAALPVMTTGEHVITDYQT